MTNSLSSSCTVVKVEAFGVAIPLKKPMRMAGVRITHAENLIVRIETNTGIVGWGESASAPTMTGDLVTGMVCAVEKLFAPPFVPTSAGDANHRLGKASGWRIVCCLPCQTPRNARRPCQA